MSRIQRRDTMFTQDNETEDRLRRAEQSLRSIEPLRAFVFANGWRPYNGGVTPASYGDQVGYYQHAGRVYFEGVLDKNGGNWILNEVIAMIDIAYAPPAIKLYKPDVRPAGSARIDVHPNGAIILVAGTTDPVGYLSLDGISYRAAS